MSRPKRGGPWLVARNGVHYAFWYDANTRRVNRQSLGVTDPRAAEIAFEAWKTARGPEYCAPAGAPADWAWWAQRMCRRARENAKAKGRPFAITPEQVAQLMARQRHACAVSGIPFSATRAFRNPFAPSIDQIAPGGGYLPGNIRIVSVIVNTAMNGWGEAPLLRLILESRFTNRGALTRQKSDVNATSEN